MRWMVRLVYILTLVAYFVVYCDCHLDKERLHTNNDNQITHEECYIVDTNNNEHTVDNVWYYTNLQTAINDCSVDKIICTSSSYIDAKNITFNGNTRMRIELRNCKLSEPAHWVIKDLHIEEDSPDQGYKSKYYKKKFNNVKKTLDTSNINTYSHNIANYNHNIILTSFYFENILFEGLGTVLSLFKDENIKGRDITIENCRIKDYTGSHFIKLGTRSSLHINNSTIEHVSGFPIYGHQLDHFSITNNEFTDSGPIYINSNYLEINQEEKWISNNKYTHTESHNNSPFINFNLQGSDNQQSYTYFIDNYHNNINLQNNIINSVNVDHGIYINHINEKVNRRSEMLEIYKNNNITVSKTDLIMELNEENTLICNSIYECSNIPPLDNNYCNITSHDTQNQLDNCEHDIYLFISSVYEISDLKFTKNNMYVLSLVKSAIIGDSHQITSNNITIKGINFVHPGSNNPIMIYSLTPDDKGYLDISNNEFKGTGVKSSPIMRLYDDDTSKMNTFIFEYNYVHDFYIDCITLRNEIDFAHMNYNLFYYNIGNSITMSNIKNSSVFENNDFTSCKGVNGVDGMNVVYLSCSDVPGTCSFKRNAQTSSGIASYNTKDVAFHLNGSGYSLNTIKANSCNGISYGLIIEDNGVSGDIHQLNIQNAYLSGAHLSEIGYIDSSNTLMINNNFNVLNSVSDQDKCRVSKEYNKFNKEDDYGYFSFSTIADAVQLCPFGVDIVIMDEIFREDLVIDRNVRITSINNDTIIYGNSHVLMAKYIVFENINFQYHCDSEYYSRELFVSNVLLEHVEFINVDFIGDVPVNYNFDNSMALDDNGIRLDAMNLHFSSNGYIKIFNCSVYDWPYINQYTQFNDVKKQFVLPNGEMKDPYTIISGGRIWLKFKKKVGISKADISNCYFDNIDSTAIRIESVNNYNVSNNVFENCGGRKVEYSAMVMIGGNPYNKDSTYYFDNNKSNQSLPVIFPLYGHNIKPSYYTTYWLYGYGNEVKEWSFTNNKASGHPVGTRLSSIDESIITSSLMNKIGTGYVNYNPLSDLSELGGNCDIKGFVYDFVTSEPIDDSFLVYNPQHICSSNKYEVVKGLNGTSCKCSVPPPQTCIVDKDDLHYNHNNVYYGTWLFSSITDAIHNCIDPNKIIIVNHSYSPYNERLILSEPNVHIKGIDNVEIIGSKHIISSNNTHIEGFTFISYGNDYLFTNPDNNVEYYKFTISNSIINNQYGNLEAVKGYFNGFTSVNVTYKHFLSRNILSLIDDGYTVIHDNKFIDFKYQAIYLENTIIGSGYDISGNLFIDNSDTSMLHQPDTIVYAKNYDYSDIVFIGNTFKSLNSLYSTDFDVSKLQYGSKSAIWIDSVKQFNIHSNYVNTSVAVGLRFTDMKTHKTLGHISNNNNTNIKGLWHDIIVGEPEKDNRLTSIPYSTNKGLICDGGCEPQDWIGIGVIMIIAISTCCCICWCVGCGSQYLPNKPDMVYSRVLAREIPKDKKYWPLIHYSRIPGWGNQIRPTPAYLIDSKANSYARKNLQLDLNFVNSNENY